jgi:signal transduction histidine kinase
MARWFAVAGSAGLAVAVGVLSLDAVRDHPGYWFAGSSTTPSIVFLATGWALVACGLASWSRRPSDHAGSLLVAAGFAWFLLEWNSPAIGSSVAFTIGLCFWMACPPLAAHAALAFPGGLSSRLERAIVGVGYVANVAVLGLLPALFYEPAEQGCAQCPTNVVAVSDNAGVYNDANRLGVWLGLAWALAFTALAVAKLVRTSTALRRATGPVLAAAAAYAFLVAATFAASLERGLVSAGMLEQRSWFAQAAALVAITLGIAWSWIRARRARRAVARLVVELAQSPPPGGLRDSLAAIVGDPELALGYPVGESERLVDAEGRPLELPAGAGRTRLVRDGRTVAVLAHAPGLLDDEQLVNEVAAAARLALENERLQAEVRARLAELRASRARIVAAGDSERKRLERDLHDGAQQRLVAFSLSLRLLRSQLQGRVGARVEDALDEADTELRRAITELRDLAHGIFPAVLADEGLAPAVEALAEEGRVPIRIRGLPGERYPAPVETAAYTVVAEAARATENALSVRGEQVGNRLVLELEGRGDGLDAVALEDRIGALDGTLSVRRGEDGGVTIHAELPCGS